jgi:hypothetical protein
MFHLLVPPPSPFPLLYHSARVPHPISSSRCSARTPTKPRLDYSTVDSTPDRGERRISPRNFEGSTFHISSTAPNTSRLTITTIVHRLSIDERLINVINSRYRIDVTCAMLVAATPDDEHAGGGDRGYDTGERWVQRESYHFCMYCTAQSVITIKYGVS